MTNAKNSASRVRECPDCKGRQFREYCPPRGKGWCVNRGWCRTCMGQGYLTEPSAKDIVSRIVRRHTPTEQDIEHRIDDVAEAAWEQQIDTQMGLL